MDVLKKDSAKKVGNDVMSKAIASIIFAGLTVVFAYSMMHKFEALMYMAITGFVFFTFFLFYLIAKKWVIKMIDERATELLEDRIANVNQTIHSYHDEQYKINCSDSDRLTKLGLQISQQAEQTRSQVMKDIEELHLPMNLAIALLVQNLSNSVYNGKDMKARTGLDDFIENYKSLMLIMNLPNKDNKYKEDMMNGYFKTLNKLYGKQIGIGHN